MRKYILVTQTFDGIGFCFDKRLEDNGDEVIIAYKNTEDDGENEEGYDLNGDGMVKCFPLDKLIAKRDKLRDYYWIWDLNHNCEENQILRDEGFKVFGGQQFTYDLENDREFGIEFAESCGLMSPEHREFTSVEEGISFLEENEDKAYVYKPNHEDNCYTTVPNNEEPALANIEVRRLIKSLGFTDYVLQERVRGVEVNVESFYVNGIPLFTQANLENKKNHNRELGVATGCAFDVCWEIDNNCELANMTVRKFDSRLKEMKYTGFGDANVIISDYNQVNFIEFCFRSGYNAHPNIFTNLSSQSFLETCADMIDGTYTPKFKRGFGASITMFCEKAKEGLPVSIPKTLKPTTYLFFVMKDEDSEEDDDVVMTGYSKEICIAMGHHYDIENALKDAEENAERINFSNASYRTDLNSDKYKNNPVSRYRALRSMKII